MKRQLKLRRVLQTGIVALLLLGSTVLVGCARSIVLHPIDKQDIVRVAKDTPYAPDRDGYFLSDLYVKEVMEAKVDKIKLEGN